MFDLMRLAMYIATLSGSGTASVSAFFLRIATLRLEIRRLDVGDQAPLEARAQTLFERGNLVRRTIAADDDLLLRVVQRVERVEELVLRAFLAGDELDVVDEQHVDRAIALAELEDAVVTARR